MNKNLLAASLFLSLAIVASGCSQGALVGNPGSVSSEANVPDLSGEWQQSNSESKDSYQSATISGTTIEVNWVSDGGDTRALYWAGTFTAPTAAGGYSWTSINDVEKTENALLASGSDTKEFTFSDGVISYEVTALGMTTTVRLAQK